MKKLFDFVVFFLFYNLSSYSQYNYCLQDNNPCPETPSGNYNISGQAWTKSNLNYYFVNSIK